MFQISGLRIGWCEMRFSRCKLLTLFLVSLCIGLSGCSSFDMTLPNLSFLSIASVKCDSSSPECLQKRAARLRKMTKDHAHAWVRLVEPLEGYAAGTRLFAYRMTKTRLSCADLAHGFVELQRANAAYGNAVPGVRPAQAKRTKSLIVKARSELGSEMRRRCKSRT